VQIIVLATSLRDMQATKCFVRAIEHTLMLLNVPVSEQSRWKDRCQDRTHRRSLPSELLRLNVTELLVANFIFCEGGQSRLTRIMQIFRRIGKVLNFWWHL
jgi:hypothetical protein